MPPKRPAPLSDEIFPANKQGQSQLQPQQQPSQVLGATNNGVPLPVKNTFIDVPSGLTPSNMRSAQGPSQAIMTAPADLSQPQGFVQRAIAASMQTQPGAPGSIAPSVPATPTPTAASRSPAVSVTQRTPLCTPSPTAGAVVSVPGSTSVSYGFNAALNAAAVSTAPGQPYFSSLPPGAPTGASLPEQCSACGNIYVSDELFCRKCGLKRPETGRPVHPVPSYPVVYQTAPAMATASALHTTQVYGNSQPMSPRSAGAATAGVLLGQSSQYQRPAAAGAAKATATDTVDEDDEEDDDSDDGQAVPPHLRNPEDAPKAPPGAEHPSLGSAEHESGNCKRCCFFPRGRCTNGYNCEFCHYEHEKRKRKNKKKKKKDPHAAAYAAMQGGQATILGGGIHAAMDPMMLGVPPLQAGQPVPQTMAVDERYVYDASRVPPVQTFVTTPAPAPTASPQVYQAPPAVASAAPSPYLTSVSGSPSQVAAAQFMPQPWETYSSHLLYPTAQPTYGSALPPPVPQPGLVAPPVQASATRAIATIPGVPVYNPPCPPPMSSPKLPIGIQQTLQTIAAQSAGSSPTPLVATTE